MFVCYQCYDFNTGEDKLKTIRYEVFFRVAKHVEDALYTIKNRVTIVKIT